MEITDFELETIIKNVNDKFYDDIFDDPWLKLVFAGVDPDHIKSQQVDFILGALGGPKRYGGRSPKDAHPHIFIQEDMWALRESYLVAAFKSANAPQWLADKWLTIDNAFKRHIINKEASECTGRFKTDPLVIIRNTEKKAA